MEVYTVAEVAAILKVSTKTVVRLLETGRLQGNDVGNGRRTWRIPKFRVEEYLHTPPDVPEPRRRVQRSKIVVNRHF